MKAVVDTNVVLSGMLWRGAPHSLVKLVKEGKLTLVTSHLLIDELTDVIYRKKFNAVIKHSGYTAEGLLREYRNMTQGIVARQRTARICRDADDDAVLACALAAKANLIVSGDKDLLVLKSFRHVPILAPSEAIRLLSGV